MIQNLMLILGYIKMEFFKLNLYIVEIKMMTNYTPSELAQIFLDKEEIEKIVQDIQNIADYNTKNRFILNMNSIPASKSQLKEWSSWKFSSNAYQKALDEEEKIKNEWRNERWNPSKEEFFLASSFETNKQKYMSTTRYKAYILYGREQRKLLYNYNKTKSDEDIDILIKHVSQHGQFIDKVPIKEINKEEVKIVEQDNTKLAGRRSKRRAKNQQIKMDNMYDELLYKPIDEDEEDYDEEE